MMTGEGPFGSVEMGGMFNVVKVRSNLPKGVYSDPGWYAQGPRADLVSFNPEIERSDQIGQSRVIKEYFARKPLFNSKG